MKRKRKTEGATDTTKPQMKIPLMQLTSDEFILYKLHEECEGKIMNGTISTNTPDDWIGPVIYFKESPSIQRNIYDDNQSYFEQLNQIKKQLIPYSTIVSNLKNESGISTSPSKEFRRASRSTTVNPYESLYFTFDGNPLISRSALKLCNIDALTDFSLKDGERKTFLDLCGAPGGFSQYLLQRNYLKGYGMSLQGQGKESIGLKWNESAFASSNFVVYHGKDGTGDVYNWNNVLGLQSLIQEDMGDNHGVDLVVADGGIDAQRNVCSQEDVAHQLITAQVAAALLLLKPKGAFIVKVFGFLTAGSKALMHSLNHFFEDFCILKPITSRPASAERYVFFKNFKGLSSDFDLLGWRNEMMESKLCTSKVSSELIHFLDKNDHDVLFLNIAGCKRLVNILHAEEDRIINSKRFRNAKSRNLALLSQYYMQKWQVNTKNA